jgi:hypothetical protein
LLLPLQLLSPHHNHVISTGVRALCGRSGETPVLALALLLLLPSPLPLPLPLPLLFWFVIPEGDLRFAFAFAVALTHHNHVISTGVRALCGRSGETPVLAFAFTLAVALLVCHPQRGSAFCFCLCSCSHPTTAMSSRPESAPFADAVERPLYWLLLLPLPLPLPLPPSPHLERPSTRNQAELQAVSAEPFYACLFALKVGPGFSPDNKNQLQTGL